MKAEAAWGSVVSVHGAVVEVGFPAGALPAIDTMLGRLLDVTGATARPWS